MSYNPGFWAMCLCVVHCRSWNLCRQGWELCTGLALLAKMNSQSGYRQRQRLNLDLLDRWLRLEGLDRLIKGWWRDLRLFHCGWWFFVLDRRRGCFGVVLDHGRWCLVVVNLLHFVKRRWRLRNRQRLVCGALLRRFGQLFGRVDRFGNLGYICKLLRDFVARPGASLAADARRNTGDSSMNMPSRHDATSDAAPEHLISQPNALLPSGPFSILVLGTPMAVLHNTQKPEEIASRPNPTKTVFAKGICVLCRVGLAGAETMCPKILLFSPLLAA